MEPMSMNDGLDGRETVAFGLATGEVAALVLALMGALAVLRSALPGAIAWCLAVLLASAGAAIAWGRPAGRPLLEWTVLLARFLLRTRHSWCGRVRDSVDGRWRAAPGVPSPAVIQLALRPHPRVVGRVAGQREVVGRPRGGALTRRPAALRSQVVAFFSLNGGSGRTTLAVEVAALLAVRGRAAQADGCWGPRVGLVDATHRNPVAAMRLGIPVAIEPSGATGPFVHESGLLVFPAPLDGPSRAAQPPAPAIAAAESAGAELVLVDLDCDLSEHCLDILRRCDEVHLVVTPTAGGVLDAYRSTATLRKLGLRERIRYVVNRSRGDHDLAETMTDLGGRIEAEVPEDEVFAWAESRHRPAALAGAGPAAAALERLAASIAASAALRDGAAVAWAESDAV